MWFFILCQVAWTLLLGFALWELSKAKREGTRWQSVVRTRGVMLLDLRSENLELQTKLRKAQEALK